MQIVPMRDLKDTTRIEKLCNESKEPIFVTKNGYGKLVVMNIEYYDYLVSQINEAKLVNKGLDDIKARKTVDGKTVMEEMKNKYGF